MAIMGEWCSVRSSSPIPQLLLLISVTEGNNLYKEANGQRSHLSSTFPEAHPAHALNVPAVPLGMLLTAAYPWASGPPYLLSWFNPQISAQDIMHTFVVLQLTTAFREGGICLRRRLQSTKPCPPAREDHLQECQIPVLALAGDKDLICPPEAVYETVKLIQKHKVNYKVFGKPEVQQYAHYDLVGGRLVHSILRLFTRLDLRFSANCSFNRGELRLFKFYTPVKAKYYHPSTSQHAKVTHTQA